MKRGTVCLMGVLDLPSFLRISRAQVWLALVLQCLKIICRSRPGVVSLSGILMKYACGNPRLLAKAQLPSTAKRCQGIP